MVSSQSVTLSVSLGSLSESGFCTVLMRVLTPIHLPQVYYFTKLSTVCSLSTLKLFLHVSDASSVDEFIIFFTKLPVTLSCACEELK